MKKILFILLFALPLMTYSQDKKVEVKKEVKIEATKEVAKNRKWKFQRNADGTYDVVRRDYLRKAKIVTA